MDETGQHTGREREKRRSTDILVSEVPHDQKGRRSNAKLRLFSRNGVPHLDVTEASDFDQWMMSGVNKVGFGRKVRPGQPSLHPHSSDLQYFLKSLHS